MNKSKQKNDNHSMHHSTESTKFEYFKFAVIIMAIVAFAYYLDANITTGTSEFLRYFMGIFMITFATFKFAGYKMFVEMFPMYDLVARRAKLYAYLFPFLEFGLGALFLLSAPVSVRSGLVILVMGVSAMGVINSVYIEKKTIQCACLGNIIKLPLSGVTIFEDVLMVVAAVAMLAFN
jgi:hypothetical protein